MATTKKKSTVKKKSLSKKQLMDKYGDMLLSTGERPANVHTFMKEIKFKEQDFYNYFSGFDALEAEYLVYFFNHSVKLLKKIDDYEQIAPKEKLLNLYYIFFENLTMNRSLILTILDTDFNSRRKIFKPLRNQYSDYIQSLHIGNLGISDKLPEGLRNQKEKSKKQAFWAHFLSVIKFWKTDQSAGFEKTDLYIEKTIDTGFELVQNPVMDKFIDLGKFIWQEKFQ